MRFTLQPGLQLRHGARILQLSREIAGGDLIFEDVLTKRPTVMSRSDVIKNYYAGKLVAVSGDLHPDEASYKPSERSNELVDLGSLSPKDRKVLEFRLAFVKALGRYKVTRGRRKEVREVISKVVASLGVDLIPSTSSVMEWARTYQTSDMNPLALLPRYGKGRKPIRLDAMVEEVLWKTLKSHYFTKMRRSAKFAYEKMCRVLKEEVQRGSIAADAAEISYATFCRRIKSVDLYHAVETREGAARARMVCRTAFPEGVPSYPLQRVEIDHTPLNWVVICDRTNLPLGRPTLTVMIDSYSGYLLGFYISFYGPGTTSVSGVVRSALMPKGGMTSAAGLSTPWLGEGLADEWVVDNGLEFHSFSFKNMAMSLGVDLMFCRVRTPWLKPRVERFFGTLNTLTLMKGRINKVVANVMRIDPYKDAAITFSDLVKGLLQFIVDVYPHEPNWRKMSTPFDLFAEGVDKMPPAIFPGNLDQLRLASGMSKMLTLDKGGIEFHGVPFGSYAFKDIVDKHGPGMKLMCKWDPDEFSKLYVKDPVNHRWHTALSRWPHYSDGLSFNQHSLIRKFSRADLQSPERVEALLKAKQNLHDHWSNTTSRRGRADALLAGRFCDLTSHKVLSPEPLSQDGLIHTATNPARIILPNDLDLSNMLVPEFDSFLV